MAIKEVSRSLPQGPQVNEYLRALRPDAGPTELGQIDIRLKTFGQRQGWQTAVFPGKIEIEGEVDDLGAIFNDPVIAAWPDEKINDIPDSALEVGRRMMLREVFELSARDYDLQVATRGNADSIDKYLEGKQGEANANYVLLWTGFNHQEPTLQIWKITPRAKQQPSVYEQVASEQTA